jgi:hypothetical protein
MKQLVKQRDALKRVIIIITDSVMIAKILYNTEEIKKNQTIINGIIKSYSQAVVSLSLSALIYIKP